MPPETSGPGVSSDPPALAAAHRLTVEHIDAVIEAARASEPIIMSLGFVVSRGGTGSGGVLSRSEAWRCITKRILQADREVRNAT